VLDVYAELGFQSFNLALYGAPPETDGYPLNLRLVSRSNLDLLYRSDATWMERLHWEAATDIVPEELARLVEGVRYMVRTRPVAVLMSIAAVFSIFGGPYLTLMPVVARDVLHGGAGAYGVLLACVGAGGLAGALFLAAVAHRVRRGRLLAGSAYAYAALLVAFALCRSVWLAAPVLLATGCMMILNSALANGLLQSIVPDAMRGRLMSAYSFVVVGLSAVVGNVIAGRVAERVGADWAIGALAAVMLAFAAWTFARHPEVAAL
jgi:MFS family permease